MKTVRWSAGLMGILLVGLAFWQVQPASSGVESVTVRAATLPVTTMTSRSASDTKGPLVLLGHGIAGSRVIMHGFAVTLARAGYRVVLWDFAGHGTNAEPLSSTGRTWSLIADAEAALAEATSRGWAAPGKVAILGHSMGSGVALAFGQTYPETAATVAVSPTGQAVTPALPRNLLLMAGSLEASFVRNAEQRLAEAGGPGGDPATGTARRLVIIPGVEHLSILFSPTAHTAAREWLDATFGPQPGAVPHTDRRIVWYGLGLLGALVVGWAVAPALSRLGPSEVPARPRWWRLAALIGAALGSTLILWLLGMAGLGLRTLLGLLVGGYLLLWFGVAGSLALLLLRTRPSVPGRRAMVAALATFAVLWIGVGLLAQYVWLPWLMIPRRLLLWPLGALLLLPWFLALGTLGADAGPTGRLGQWLVGSATLVGAMVLALRLSPDLGFLILILPLFPIILGIHALAVAPYRGPWPYAFSGALFTSWLLLAVFPLL
jgi:pimeloyl-ACP methyl ester carboxylesterase